MTALGPVICKRGREKAQSMGWEKGERCKKIKNGQPEKRKGAELC
jgi:hypothetical protein